MKNLLMIFAVLLFLNSGVFSAVSKNTKELSVTVKPDQLVLNDFGGWVPGTYVFKNNSKETIDFGGRNAVFTSADGKWTSFNIGPLKTKITIDPGETYEFVDNILVPYEIMIDLYRQNMLKNGDFGFIQNFDYQCGDKQGTVSVKWDVKMTETPEKLGYIITNTAYFTVVTKKYYFPSEYSAKNMKKFLTFSDSAVLETEKILGFKSSVKQIDMRIGSYDNYVNVTSAFFEHVPYTSPYLFFTADLVAYPCEWIYLLCPVEIVNLFLTSEFGFPPLWMYHGQKPFFAYKVCANLGYGKIAQDDSVEFIQMGDKYAKTGKNYLFTDKWEMDNPGAMPLAVGRAYQLLAELEKLCGSDIFVKLFSKWKKDGFKFPMEMNSIEKTALIIDALAKISGSDVLGLFTKFGYQPEK